MAAYVPIGASSTPPSLFLVGVLHFPTYWSGNLTTLYCTSAGSSGGTGTLEDPFTGTDAYEVAWAALNNGKGKIFCARGSEFENTDDITHTGGQVHVEPYGTGADPIVDMGTFGHDLDGFYYEVVGMSYKNWDRAGSGCFEVLNAGGLLFDGCTFDGEFVTGTPTSVGSAIRFLGTVEGDDITDYYTPMSIIRNCTIFEIDGDGVQQFGNAPFKVQDCLIHSLRDTGTDFSTGALGATDAIVAHAAWGTSVEISGCTLHSNWGKSVIELKDAIGSVHHNILYYNDPAIGNIVARFDVGASNRPLNASGSPGDVEIYCNCVLIGTGTVRNVGYGYGIGCGEGGKARIHHNTVYNFCSRPGPAEPFSGFVPSYHVGSTCDLFGNISLALSNDAHHLCFYGHVLHDSGDILVRSGPNIYHSEGGGINRYSVITTSPVPFGTVATTTEIATLALFKANAEVAALIALGSQVEVDTRVTADPNATVSDGTTYPQYQPNAAFHAAHNFIHQNYHWETPVVDPLGNEFPRDIGFFGAMSPRGVQVGGVTSTNTTASKGAIRIPLESPYDG